MADEVKVLMKLKNNSTGETRNVFRMYSGCEQAWTFMSTTMRKAIKRRATTDRETVLCAYYYGKTITGKTYGGMHIVHGQHVRPQDNDSLRNLSYAKDFYSEMDSAIKAA
jgi:hypothetical protein